MNPPLGHAGIILAAGASSRMGQPKALLEDAQGRPLATVQADLLIEAGCEPTLIVLGAMADRIVPRLDGYMHTTHSAWAKGRITSLQAGLKACPERDGYVVLPVDAVGISHETVRTLLRTATDGVHQAIRPYYDDQPGHLLWISKATADLLLDVDGDDDPSLREVLADRVTRLDLNDPALLSNINTPAQWEQIKNPS